SAASGEGAQHEVLLRSSPRLALRLAGLRVYSRLRAGSPGKARSAATRGMRRDECIGAASPRLALRLAGLRVHSRLRTGSPPPGKVHSMRFCCGLLPGSRCA
ncbi:TPA: hypothetical protein ACGQW2_003779, partial [Klebsiella michiganensis]